MTSTARIVPTTASWRRWFWPMSNTQAATAKKAFEPNVPGGDAKPEVWANWKDFSKRLDDLTAATAELAKTAKAGGIAAAGPKVQDALTCKGCHDVYREKKK